MNNFSAISERLYRRGNNNSNERHAKEERTGRARNVSTEFRRRFTSVDAEWIKIRRRRIGRVTAKDWFHKRRLDSMPAAKVPIGTVNEARCKFSINRGYVPRWKKPDNLRFIAGNRCCLAVKSQRGKFPRCASTSARSLSIRNRTSRGDEFLSVDDLKRWQLYLRAGTRHIRANRNRLYALTREHRDPFGVEADTYFAAREMWPRFVAARWISAER